MLQDQTTSARDPVLEILRHVDGIIYVESSTGLLTMRLVRFDYEAADLPVLDSDSCTVTSFARPSWGELTVSSYHRNRLRAWSYVNSGWTSAPQPNTEYEIPVYGELGTLIHTETGITGTSWTYLEADERLDSGLERLNTHLRIKIRTWSASRTCGAIREIDWEVDRV